eukprot:50809-Heterocapsa_arctica.AAC.1
MRSSTLPSAVERRARVRHLSGRPSWHYVDAFSGIEAAGLASSAFHGFATLNNLLGFLLKPPKAQPPAPNGGGATEMPQWTLSSVRALRSCTPPCAERRCAQVRLLVR